MEPAEFKEVMKDVKALQLDLARIKRELEKESKESRAKGFGEHYCMILICERSTAMCKRLILVASPDYALTDSLWPVTKGKGGEDEKELFLALVNGSLSSSKTFVRSRSF